MTMGMTLNGLMSKNMISCVDNEAGEVLRVVANYYGVDAGNMQIPTRHRGIAFMRMVAMYCLWHYTELNSWDIGGMFGRDRTMVNYSLNQINNLCKNYPDVRK